MFPNPVTHTLSVSSLESGNFYIYDSTGKQIYSSDMPSGITKLNTTDYEVGIYLMRIITNEGVTCVRFLKGS